MTLSRITRETLAFIIMLITFIFDYHDQDTSPINENVAWPLQSKLSCLGIIIDEIYDRSNDRKYRNYNTSRKKNVFNRNTKVKNMKKGSKSYYYSYIVNKFNHNFSIKIFILVNNLYLVFYLFSAISMN